MIKRKATAKWQGTGKEGSGTIDSNNKFFNETPFSFKTRFENEDGKLGTNPEELIAAAHASCFTMALSFAISKAGFSADYLKTDAIVNIESTERGFTISKIELILEGKVNGLIEEHFIKFANDAKQNCPVSKALSAVPITLNIKFI